MCPFPGRGGAKGGNTGLTYEEYKGRALWDTHPFRGRPMFVMRVWCGSSQVKSIKDRCLTIGANPTSQGGKQASKLFACLLACLLARADWCGLETPQVSALPRTVPSQKGGPTAD